VLFLGRQTPIAGVDPFHGTTWALLRHSSHAEPAKANMPGRGARELPNYGCDMHIIVICTSPRLKLPRSDIDLSPQI